MFFCENRVKIMMRKVESSIEILKSSKNESLMFTVRIWRGFMEVE